ncbi:MAG: right-handed parallel beta-helix repeat-containing protein [Kiritimatiellae bacterium]|nr:right-handed parallel beta-helix repeat-containing protein [Kiritimatiellia bacterium]
MNYLSIEKRTHAVLFAGVFFLASITSSWAGTLYVWTNSPSPSSPYATWENAAHDIQSAIDAASNGDTVLVTNGVYSTGMFSNEYGVSRVGITKGVTLRSVEGPEASIIRGDFSTPARCVYINHTNAALLGFTLENGQTSTIEGKRNGGGALIYNIGLMSNCVMRNNRTATYGWGGGIAVISAAGMITHCDIRQNEASSGGGSSIRWGSGTIFEHCTVISNAAQSGGGLVVDNCKSVRHCIVLYNHAAAYGGGIFLDNNTCLSSCTIEKNTANARGAGVFLQGVDNRLCDNTMYYNGAENFYYAGPDGAINMIEFCCTPPLTNSVTSRAIVTNEPKYADFENDDYRLSESSPCRDAGLQEDWMMEGIEDFYGNPRVAKKHVDIGAHEFWTDETRDPTVFYVATNGNDQATGLSLNDPFRTVQKGLAVLAPGDTLYIRGGTYREFLIVPVDGEQGHPVTVCAYSNETPMIKGSVLATNWIHHADSIWKLTNWVRNTQQLFDDGACLRQIGYPNECYGSTPTYPFIPYGLGLADMVAGSFYYAANENVLYVWLSDHSNPSESIMEASTARSVLFKSARYNNIYGLHFMHVNTLGYSMGGYAAVNLGEYSTMDSCDVSWMDATGVGVSDNTQVINCNVSHNGMAGFGGSPDSFLVRGCIINSNNYNGFSVGCHCGGMKFMPAQNGTVESNVFVGNLGYGIWFDTCPEGSNVIRGNLIRETARNWKDGTTGSAIFYEISPGGALIHDNMLVDNDGCGICIAESCNTRVFNNTIIGQQGRFALGCRTGQRSDLGYPAPFTNNYVFNNLIYENACTWDIMWPTNKLQEDNYIFDNQSDYNCFFRANSNYLFHGGTVNYTNLLNYSANTGFDSNSIVTNPVFRCPPLGDYRPAESSPCINQGTTNIAAIYDWAGVADYAGETRLIGDQVDLGCHEFSASPESLAPLVVITSPVGLVSYDVTTVSGANNFNVSGAMTATVLVGGNLATVQVSRVTPYTWTLATNLTFISVPYTITVYATNEHGVLVSNQAVITRGGIGSGMPLVNITNGTGMVVSEASCVIGGSRNEQTASTMWWSNVYNGAVISSGSFSSAVSWTASITGLFSGLNRVYVQGSNAWGMMASDSLLIDQGPTPAHYVSTNVATPVYPFASLETAAHTIQEAVDAAADGDTVYVAGGVYKKGFRDNTCGRSRLVIEKGITVVGVDGPENVIIDGGTWATRCVYVNHTNASVYGVAMMHGSILGNSVDLRTTSGAGALVINMKVLSNCCINGNSALVGGWGGGIALIAAAGKMTHCTIKHNQAGWGGGIEAHWAGNTVIENCLVISNYASGMGGGVVLDNGKNLRNCLIMDNYTDGYGGGIGLCNNAGFQHCTLLSNSAPSQRGSGIHVDGYGAIIKNCIMTEPDALHVGGASQNNQIQYCSAPVEISGTGNFVGNPQFLNAAAGDYHLKYGSPCIDAGTNLVEVTYDLGGNARPLDGNFDGIAQSDIGCYEYNPQTTDSDGDGMDDGWEHGYGYNLTNSADVALDTDGDRMSAWGEYVAGTDPTDASSMLTIDSTAYRFFASSPLEYGANLLLNTDFEAHTNQWTALGNSTVTNWRSHGGAESGILTGSWMAQTNYSGLIQSVSIAGGQIYRCGGWFQRESNWTNPTVLKLEFFDASYAFLSRYTCSMTELPTETWMDLYLTGDAPLNAVYAQMVVEATGVGNDGTFYADDVVLQHVTGGDTSSVDLSWTAKPGRIYRVDSTTNLVTGTWTLIRDNITSDTESLHTLSLTNIRANVNSLLYRLGVKR